MTNGLRNYQGLWSAMTADTCRNYRMMLALIRRRNQLCAAHVFRIRCTDRAVNRNTLLLRLLLMVMDW